MAINQSGLSIIPGQSELDARTYGRTVALYAYELNADPITLRVGISEKRRIIPVPPSCPADVFEDAWLSVVEYVCNSHPMTLLQRARAGRGRDIHERFPSTFLNKTLGTKLTYEGSPVPR